MRERTLEGDVISTQFSFVRLLDLTVIKLLIGFTKDKYSQIYICVQWVRTSGIYTRSTWCSDFFNLEVSPVCAQSPVIGREALLLGAHHLCLKARRQKPQLKFQEWAANAGGKGQVMGVPLPLSSGGAHRGNSKIKEVFVLCTSAWIPEIPHN